MRSRRPRLANRNRALPRTLKPRQVSLMPPGMSKTTVGGEQQRQDAMQHYPSELTPGPEIHLQADIARIARLKELSATGKIEGRSSYFNHLLDMYGKTSRLGTRRTFTDRERKRVDVFLQTFVQ